MSNSNGNFLKTQTLTRVAFAAALLVCVYYAFNQIVYLELVTATLLLYAVNFKTRDAFLISIVFSMVILIMYGPQSFAIMYMVIFPIYTLLSSLLRKVIVNHLIFAALYAGFFSFILGTLVDLPYLLLSGKATLIYLISGLQVGIPKAMATVVVIVFAFEPLNNILKQILKGN